MWILLNSFMLWPKSKLTKIIHFVRCVKLWSDFMSASFSFLQKKTTNQSKMIWGKKNQCPGKDTLKNHDEWVMCGILMVFLYSCPRFCLSHAFLSILQTEDSGRMECHVTSVFHVNQSPTCWVPSQWNWWCTDRAHLWLDSGRDRCLEDKGDRRSIKFKDRPTRNRWRKKWLLKESQSEWTKWRGRGKE